MTDEVQAAVDTVQTSDPVVEQPTPETVAPDTTNEEVTVEETDEQKNEAVQKAAAEKAERKARGVQKRMDELTADKYAERKRADELAAQNARILALLEQQKPQQAPSTGAPQREQFADDFSFVRAEAAYVAQQEALKLIQHATRAQQEQFAQAQAQQAARLEAQQFAERMKAVEKTIPDYREVLEDAEIELPPQVLVTIRKMADGPLVAYHLAKNPDLATQFITTPPEMHGILLGQLSATLKTVPQVSKAPPPGKPVQTKPGSSSEPPSNPDEYQAWAAKHMR